MGLQGVKHLCVPIIRTNWLNWGKDQKEERMTAFEMSKISVPFEIFEPNCQRFLLFRRYSYSLSLTARRSDLQYYRQFFGTKVSKATGRIQGPKQGSSNELWQLWGAGC